MVKPMEPPTVRMDSDSAAVVASKASGTTIKATVAAGTSRPPTPKLAMVPRATASLGVSGVVAARAPVKAAGSRLDLWGSFRIWEGLTHSSLSKRSRECTLLAPSMTAGRSRRRHLRWLKCHSQGLSSRPGPDPCSTGSRMRWERS